MFPNIRSILGGIFNQSRYLTTVCLAPPSTPFHLSFHSLLHLRPLFPVSRSALSHSPSLFPVSRCALFRSIPTVPLSFLTALGGRDGPTLSALSPRAWSSVQIQRSLEQTYLDAWLDALETDESPPTEAQITRAWLKRFTCVLYAYLETALRNSSVWPTYVCENDWCELKWDKAY